MILTKEIIEQGKSDRGGWSADQFICLGVGKDDKTKGWISRLVGKEFPDANIKEFLALKNNHLKKKIEQQKVKKLVGFVSFEIVTTNLSLKDQYLHPNWQKLRLFVLNRDQYKCVNCWDKNKTLHVHHLKYLPGKFIWEVPKWYLVTLCEDCHSEEHGRDLRAK